MSPASAYRIDAEIFSAGTWNEETFTRADLEQIARNFETLQGQLKPPLKFGHDEGQTLLGQSDGDPALGWVEALRVEGDRLVATFAGLPRIVYDAIRAGRYRRVSAELYLDVRRGGQALGKALKAVALLGADLPAVTNLQDLTAFLSASPPPDFEPGPCAAFNLALARPAAGRPAAGPSVAGQAAPTPPAEEEHPMTPVPTRDELEAEVLELRAYREQQEHVQAQARSRRKDEAFRKARADVVAFCDEQVAAGRLTPHLRERLLRDVEQQVHSFKEGAGLRVGFDWLREFFASAAPPALGRELAHGAPSEAGPQPGENPSMTLSRLAAQRMVELNLTYSDAAAYVLKAHPALARAYRDYTLNLSLGG